MARVTWIGQDAKSDEGHARQLGNEKQEKIVRLLTTIFPTRYDGPASCISMSASTASSRPDTTQLELLGYCWLLWFHYTEVVCIP